VKVSSIILSVGLVLIFGGCDITQGDKIKDLSDALIKREIGGAYSLGCPDSCYADATSDPICWFSDHGDIRCSCICIPPFTDRTSSKSSGPRCGHKGAHGPTTTYLKNLTWPPSDAGVTIICKDPDEN
jgi:hypothetical protein